MDDSFNYETYLSPFTWRYGSDNMRRIWSLAHKRRLWRRIWVALAEAQHGAGLVTVKQLEDLRTYQNDVDLVRAHELEAQLRHDLMAEVKTYAEQCTVGGGIIHLGATSMDIEDNADALRLRDALDLILIQLRDVLSSLSSQIECEAEHVCMAFTHLQPAEPTTIGYRLAAYAQDLAADYIAIKNLRAQIKGKGFKGAVGTSASYHVLLDGTDMFPADMEAHIMQSLGLEAYSIANQTYPRRQDWQVVSALAGLAMTIYRFAFDLRLLQSPPYGEWAEPFGKNQVGSSAMPFKRNPINAENIDSLARFIATLPRVMWDNAAHSLLERTLDDSGNRRVVLPEAFLATDEILKRFQRLMDGLRVDSLAIQRNLDQYGVFAATERVLMAAVKKGGDRQILHEVIRKHSLTAWSALREGKMNPLSQLLSHDSQLTALLSEAEILQLLRVDDYVGDAPDRAKSMAVQLRDLISD